MRAQALKGRRQLACRTVVARGGGSVAPCTVRTGGDGRGPIAHRCINSSGLTLSHSILTVPCLHRQEQEGVELHARVEAQHERVAAMEVGIRQAGMVLEHSSIAADNWSSGEPMNT